ncbi:DUF1294 domain-containing protein [Terribacillus sp. 7520-G]|uniref:DUF1294 domain-containing protein n=1 Tax=Terribacillus TaxID=459532 RepID=UPI000BA73215|nr:hypothetical protein CHH53_08240 [Terribacillus sp. 7520-G]
MWLLISLYLLVVNILLFSWMGIDKQRARTHAWRISERRLWITAVIGGALGGWAGMQAFRHKTKHAAFVIGFPCLVAMHVLLILYFL